MSTAVPTITRDGVPSGGLTPETEVLTTRGPVRVDALSVGDRVYALSESTRLVKPKFVKRIDRVPFEASLIALSGKRIDLHLHPTHQVLFTTKARPEPRYRQASDLTQQEYYLNQGESPGL